MGWEMITVSVVQNPMTRFARQVSHRFEKISAQKILKFSA